MPKNPNSNNPRRSSSFSKSLVGPGFPKGRTNIPWPSISEYPIVSLAVLKDLPSYFNICLLAIIVMISLVVLCAMRENTTESNAEFDNRPFVRYMKRNLFGTGDTLVVAASLAVVPVLGIIDTSTPVQVENFIKAAISNYRPNIKAPKQVNASNVDVWVNGQISRILGLINSCPASVAGLYNFGLTPGRSSSTGVKQLVDSIPLPNKPSAAYVIFSFRLIMGLIEDNEEGVARLISEPQVFNETALTFAGKSNLSTLGISPLEWELFTVKIPRKSGVFVPGVEIKRQLDTSSLITPNTKTKLRALDEADLQELLSPLEFASYRSASKLGIKSRLQELNEAALSRKEAKSSGSEKPDPIAEDDSSSLQEFASNVAVFYENGEISPGNKVSGTNVKTSRKRGRPSASPKNSPSAPKVPSRDISPNVGSEANEEGQKENVSSKGPESEKAFPFEEPSKEEKVISPSDAIPDGATSSNV